MRLRPWLRARSTQTPVETTSATQKTFDINERTAFLKEDLKHLFDDIGVDSTAYDDVVDFRDPITKYSTLQGYMFNIQFLKRVFKPTLEVHDIRPVGPLAIVSRWTMTMDFMPAKWLPTASLWAPKIIFSGTSTYGFNPANGKINVHVDTWDSIKNQSFFSIEAFIDFLRQMSATYTIPKDLETPQYTVLRRASDYQVRRYEPFLVAETPMDAARAGQPSQPKEFSPAGNGFQSFNTLARYIFGGNEQKEQMAMTTPVFSDTKGTMQFVIGPAAHKDLTSVPKPLPGAPVTSRMEPACVCAVRTFGGIADERNSEQEAQKLIKSLERDGLLYERQAGWRLARYNDPGTLPPFRRNEVLVTLSEPYELWNPGELEAVTKGAGF